MHVLLVHMQCQGLHCYGNSVHRSVCLRVYQADTSENYFHQNFDSSKCPNFIYSDKPHPLFLILFIDHIIETGSWDVSNHNIGSCNKIVLKMKKK